MSIEVSPVPVSVQPVAVSDRASYLAHLIALAQQAPDRPELADLRRQAEALLQEQAFPTLRDEEWRFTDLRPLLKLTLQAVDSQGAVPSLSEIQAFILPEAEQSRLVFVDGVYAPELSAIASLPSSITVGSLTHVSGEIRAALLARLGKQPGAEELFTALNTAGLSDAAVVWVPKNTVVDQPIHLLFIATGGAKPLLIQPRGLVVADANSAVTLIEDYVALGEGAHLTNAVTEIGLAENAQVNHSYIQRDRHTAFHIGKTAVSQARSSRYVGNAINYGAQISRHHFEVNQTGEQTETVLNGLTYICGEQLSDTHSTLAYAKPYGSSRQLHKCIVGDRAHAVFNGRVVVPQAAQLTDAGQLNRTLLLSSKARVDTKPQLEIVADNVKCTHGATVGQLDADELFYLQSRGIDLDTARHLLVYAFAYDILQHIPLESLRQQLLAQTP